MKHYRTLDALVVIAVLVELGFVLFALVYVKIPVSQLPIIAGLAGTMFGGTVGLYAGARWGNKKTDEPQRPGDVDVSVRATATTPDT